MFYIRNSGSRMRYFMSAMLRSGSFSKPDPAATGSAARVFLLRRLRSPDFPD